MAIVGSPREERRLVQHDLSRNQLLDAAEEVFGRKGFHGTTLKEVAELAEFSVGSVYSFFDSKDDLFRQIFVRRGDDFMPGLRRLLAGRDADPVTQLHLLVDYEVGFFRSHPRFGRLVLRDPRVIGANDEESMRLQADLFARGQRRRVFHDGDPDVLARLFSGLIAAYQALDPAVVSDDPGAAERFRLVDLHDLVDRTFVIAG